MIDINEHELSLLLNGPAVGAVLERVGDLYVVATKQNLSTPHDPHERNPPPGPPRRRTGDLVASIRREDARVIEGHLEVQLVAPAVHGGRLYDQELRQRGYEFIDIQRVTV